MSCKFVQFNKCNSIKQFLFYKASYCGRCSAARVYTVTKEPRSSIPSSKWPQKFDWNNRCRITEYQATISNIGRVIQKNCLNRHGLKCRIECKHRLLKKHLNPCPIAEPCPKYIRL